MFQVDVMHFKACPLLHLYLKAVAPNWQPFSNPCVSTNSFKVLSLSSAVHSSAMATDISV